MAVHVESTETKLSANIWNDLGFDLVEESSPKKW